MVDANGFDTIVVGTGPGGATVARELTRRGARVLMLEWGPLHRVRGSALQLLAEGGLPGRQLVFTSGLLPIMRGVTVPPRPTASSPL